MVQRRFGGTTMVDQNELVKAIDQILKTVALLVIFRPVCPERTPAMSRRQWRKQTTRVGGMAAIEEA
jgi:hypothetical protein